MDNQRNILVFAVIVAYAASELHTENRIFIRSKSLGNRDGSKVARRISEIVCEKPMLFTPNQKFPLGRVYNASLC